MRKDNFVYLLFALLVFLVALPVLDDLAIISPAITRPVAFTCLLAIGVWSLRDSVLTFRIGMALAATGVVANVLSVASESLTFYFMSVAALFAFLLLAIRSALHQVVIGTDISANRLFGALCVYLMLGVLWALMYSVLAAIDPHAFAGALAPAGKNDWTAEWLYYSFITLTTLGYGDILPVSATARVLAYGEAVIGVFYMAVLVAALVGSYASARSDDKR